MRSNSVESNTEFELVHLIRHHAKRATGIAVAAAFISNVGLKALGFTVFTANLVTVIPITIAAIGAVATCLSYNSRYFDFIIVCLICLADRKRPSQSE